MARQSNRKITRVLLTVGAPIVVAVLGVSLGLAGGSAQADNGQSIILGLGGSCNGGSGTNCATVPTEVINTASGGGDGFVAIANDGYAGLFGQTSADASSLGGGVAGVEGDGAGPGDDGVLGFSASANGVTGTSVNGPGNGVYGHANNSAASGVYGQNDGTGFGVAGRANSGTGTLGDSANGVGVWASSQNAIALKVTGRAQFSRSGVATVAGTSASPQKSVQVSLPITGKSMMTALLQKYVPGVYVLAAVPNVTGGYFTIYLNKAMTTSIGPIAWIVTETP